MTTPPRQIHLREARFNAQRRLLRTNRRLGRDFIIRTPAGGALTEQQVQRWLNPTIFGTLQGCEAVIDVYLEQVCHAINRRRRLIRANGTAMPNRMRAMLSQPHTFYHQIMRIGGERRASRMLRDAHISREEFRQLEYFFVPVVLRGHACLIAVSPRLHTVEIADSSPRNTRTMCRIFNIIVRFLIHELGSLPSPRWRFLNGHNPPQQTILACGNFTCLAAQALAGGQPMDGWSDFGQGNTADSEVALKDRIIDDLFHQGGWSELILPSGDETIQQRHAPGGHSELQHVVFSNLPGFLQVPPDDHITRRLISQLRANTSIASLAEWCLSQGLVRNQNGHFILRMQGHSQWALGNWSRFLLRVEMREEDVRQAQWP